MRKIIIITGATGALGQALAKELMSNGNILILISRNQKELKQLRQSLNGECYFYVCDVRNLYRVKKVIKDVIKKFLRINALVNVAGILGPVGKFHTNKMEEWRKVLEVNLLGTVNTCYAVLPYLIKQQSGKIVNFSGGGAVKPFENLSGYATSKSAVVRFTENLAVEYAAYNIQINAVAPGMIWSKMLRDALRAKAVGVGKNFYDRIMNVKRGKGIDPSVAAKLVAFLLEPSNKLTGKLISAEWDPWKQFKKQQINKINSSGLYTIRRIDNDNFFEK